MAKNIYDWQAVQAYHDEGHGFVECSRRFGFTHTAWNKAIKRGRLRVPPSRFRDRRRRYDWAQVQEFYDAGNSYAATAVKFGFCAEAWYGAISRGEIKARHRIGMPIAELLSGPRENRSHIKMRLLKAGLLEKRCQRCGLAEWRGKPLSIHLDHINGVNRDNRLENLRMLCPNCHSQTQTFSGRNVRRHKREESR
jgi:5-methylcytosine-specific restriction endonuclease McrA